MAKPKIDPEKLYTTREVAALAGRTDKVGINSVNMLLNRRNIGQIIGDRRIIQGTDVPGALELLKSATPGNPEWIEAGEAKKKVKRPKGRKSTS